ncbi:MAG: efflux RND transporter periplasmic adaptor subunit [Terriglobia bacterium]|jgi:RND family efflux transporter MFP subunit
MEERRETGSRITAFLAGAGLVSLIVALSFVWRPAREKLASLLKPRPSSPASLAPTTDSSGRKILYYEDPMHPWYKSNKPGIAPDCGMKLVAVYADEQQTAAVGTLPPGAVQISPARQQLMGVTTALADYRPVEKTIRTVGQVAIDETRLANVHVKVNGWIQEVFVDYTWQPVKKGEPLFTIYSPDLLATEQEYLLALRARKALGTSSYMEVSSGSESLLEAARQRLALWDLTDAQIGQLEETGKAQHEITFYAPASGYVMERKAYPNQYVTPDTELYKLVDLNRVWVQADVYEFEMPAVSLGQEATMTTESLPGASWKGRLVFINPEVKTDTRTGTVRMEFPNPELKLKPGMFVNVELHKSFGRQLTVPVDAVIDSGTRQVVFVDLGKGAFAPREVKVGERTQDYLAILSGLRAGDHVVTRANFLIDSESNLRQSIEGMAGMPGMQSQGKKP